MRRWHSAALGCMFRGEGRAQALCVGDGRLVAARGPLLRLALGLGVARGAQAGVAHWAGATVRNGPGRADRGGAVNALAQWGQRRAAAEARCQLFDRVLVVLVPGWVEGRGFVRRNDAVA